MNTHERNIIARRCGVEPAPLHGLDPLDPRVLDAKLTEPVKVDDAYIHESAPFTVNIDGCLIEPECYDERLNGYDGQPCSVLIGQSATTEDGLYFEAILRDEDTDEAEK